MQILTTAPNFMEVSWPPDPAFPSPVVKTEQYVVSYKFLCTRSIVDYI